MIAIDDQRVWSRSTIHTHVGHGRGKCAAPIDTMSPRPTPLRKVRERHQVNAEQSISGPDHLSLSFFTFSPLCSTPFPLLYALAVPVYPPPLAPASTSEEVPTPLSLEGILFRPQRCPRSTNRILYLSFLNPSGQTLQLVKERPYCMCLWACTCVFIRINRTKTKWRPPRPTTNLGGWPTTNFGMGPRAYKSFPGERIYCTSNK